MIIRRRKTMMIGLLLILVILSVTTSLFVVNTLRQPDSYFMNRIWKTGNSWGYIELHGWGLFGREFTTYSYDPNDPSIQVIGGWAKGFVDWFGGVHITFRSSVTE